MGGIVNMVSQIYRHPWIPILTNLFYSVCKNYDEVIGYLESVKAYDAQQIY